MYNRELIKFVQKELSEQTGLRLTVDGVAGRETFAALLHIEQIPTTWSTKRQVIGYVQYLCATEGINAGPIDGYAGPQTEEGYEKLKVKYIDKQSWKPWRSEEGEGLGNAIGGFIGDMFGKKVNNDWPIQKYSELVKYYGPVGKNQTTIKLPYPFRLSWNHSEKRNSITCHEKVADSTVRVLERVQDFYGRDIKDLGLDLWGGTLNVRRMRGSSAWSTHAWGIAHDFDTTRNKLRWGKDKANFAKPVYNKFWELWEEEGWISLGRERNYDYMHVQAAKIRKK